MGALDFLTAPLRSLLGVTADAERDVANHSPLHETGELERQLEETVTSIHRACDSMERHVDVVETLATTVPKLSDSVSALVEEMHALNSTLKPVASAEQEVASAEHEVASAEHEISRLGHLFGHRHAAGGTSTTEPQAPAKPPADPGRT